MLKEDRNVPSFFFDSTIVICTKMRWLYRRITGTIIKTWLVCHGSYSLWIFDYHFSRCWLNLFLARSLSLSRFFLCLMNFLWYCHCFPPQLYELLYYSTQSTHGFVYVCVYDKNKVHYREFIKLKMKLHFLEKKQQKQFKRIPFDEYANAHKCVLEYIENIPLK